MTIRLSLDLSDLAALAVPKAAELAKALDKELLFVTVAGPGIRAALMDFAGLIVIASHGRTGSERWMVGSVAVRIVRGATVPVMVIPAPWRSAPTA